MKTTLDLPADVARTLRLESTRRGGRKVASLTRLVTGAVRRTHAKPGPTAKVQLDLTPGRAILAPPAGTAKLSHEDVRAALYDCAHAPRVRR
jgi:hypothetical protein